MRQTVKDIEALSADQVMIMSLSSLRHSSDRSIRLSIPDPSGKRCVVHSNIHSSLHPSMSYVHSFIHSFMHSFHCLRGRCTPNTFSLHSLRNTQAFDRQPLLRTDRRSGMVSVGVPVMQLLHCPSPCSLLPNRRARSSAVCAEPSNAKHTSHSWRLP